MQTPGDIRQASWNLDCPLMLLCKDVPSKVYGVYIESMKFIPIWPWMIGHDVSYRSVLM